MVSVDHSLCVGALGGCPSRRLHHPTQRQRVCHEYSRSAIIALRCVRLIRSCCRYAALSVIGPTATHHTHIEKTPAGEWDEYSTSDCRSRRCSFSLNGYYIYFNPFYKYGKLRVGCFLTSLQLLNFLAMVFKFFCRILILMWKV